MRHGGKPAPLTTRAQVDLDRFTGEWYVIANIPYFAERGKVATRDVYRLREDGRIDNIFVFQRGDFDAPERRWNGASRVVSDSGNAHGRVHFIWPFSTDLLILEVDPGYRWALLGHPARRYAWIYAREPDRDPAQHNRLRERFRD